MVGCGSQREPQPIPEGVGEFSGATYGDALILWGKDRQTIEALNAQLEAIGRLGDE